MLFSPFCWGWNLIQTFGFLEVKLTFLVFLKLGLWKRPLPRLMPHSRLLSAQSWLQHSARSQCLQLLASLRLHRRHRLRCACPSLLVFPAQGASASCLPLFLTEAACCVPVFPLSYSLCFLENRSEFLLWVKIHGPHWPLGDPVWPALPSVPTQTTGAPQNWLFS